VNPDLLSAIGSLASVAVAVIAAVVAYFAWRTAQSASEATAALTEIEKARWHADNRPEFQVEASGVVEDNGIAACSITLIGAKALDWVDVVATIRPYPFSGGNDRDPGPYEWDDTANDYYESPTDSKKFRLVVGEDATLWMRGATDEEWHRYTRPIRLWLRCTAENGDTWMVPASCKLTPLQLAEGIVTREEVEAQSEAKWAHLNQEEPQNP
jgi:hypothetical protein